MGKTLGLNDDYYHGIIPFVILMVSIPAIFWSGYSPVALMRLAVVVIMLITLQFFNEWKQAVDPHVFEKYGSWEGFQKNSRKDTKLFVIGSFLGLFFGLLVYAVLRHMVGT